MCSEGINPDHWFGGRHVVPGVLEDHTSFMRALDRDAPLPDPEGGLLDYSVEALGFTGRAPR